MLLSKPSHILLATCLLLSLTACSQDPDENPPGIITLVDQGSGGEDTDMNGPLADMVVSMEDLGQPGDMTLDMTSPVDMPPARDMDMADMCQGDDCPTETFSDEHWATATWETAPNAPSIRANQDDMWCFDDESCVVVNSSGQIWRTDDGLTWNKLVDQPGTFFRAVSFFDEQVGIAANIGPGITPSIDDTNVLYRTEDGGQNWTPLQTPDGLPGICNLHTVDEDVMWASGRVSGPGWVGKSLDKGLTWEWFDMSEHLSWVIDIEMQSADTGLVIGNFNRVGRVIRTTDGGISWQVVWESETSSELPWKISFPSEQVGYIGVQNNATSGPTHVLKTTDGGQTWDTIEALETPYKVKGIGFATENVGWLAGESQAYQTSDGGQTWEPVDGLTIGVNRFRFPAPGVAWAVGTSVWRLDLRE
ncbi:MAG: YCF48-related protein [Myxococcota bacterium]|nr:YCF48-related protein [Myxococcota bacterium]MEC9443245.1 YCF48-related protein [Myxococcota bacterium]